MATRLHTRLTLGLALVATLAAIATAGIACGGGASGSRATPTARPLPGQAANGGSPGFMNGTPPADFTPGAFNRQAGAFFGGVEESQLADFLGISQDQFRAELQADGATVATVAEAHGKSQDDLKAFLTDALTKNIPNTVDQIMNGTMRVVAGAPPAGTDTPSP